VVWHLVEMPLAQSGFEKGGDLDGKLAVSIPQVSQRDGEEDLVAGGMEQGVLPGNATGVVILISDPGFLVGRQGIGQRAVGVGRSSAQGGLGGRKEVAEHDPEVAVRAERGRILMVVDETAKEPFIQVEEQVDHQDVLNVLQIGFLHAVREGQPEQQVALADLGFKSRQVREDRVTRRIGKSEVDQGVAGLREDGQAGFRIQPARIRQPIVIRAAQGPRGGGKYQGRPDTVPKAHGQGKTQRIRPDLHARALLSETDGPARKSQVRGSGNRAEQEFNNGIGSQPPARVRIGIAVDEQGSEIDVGEPQIFSILQRDGEPPVRELGAESGEVRGWKAHVAGGVRKRPFHGLHGCGEKSEEQEGPQKEITAHRFPGLLSQSRRRLLCPRIHGNEAWSAVG
jgi:hypothetical protein